MMLGNIPMPGRPIIGPIALAVGAGWLVWTFFS